MQKVALKQKQDQRMKCPYMKNYSLMFRNADKKKQVEQDTQAYLKHTNSCARSNRSSRQLALSNSNSSVRKRSYIEEKEDAENFYKEKRKFKARRIPSTHRVPFVCFYSTNQLTKPKEFKLRTKERSTSRDMRSKLSACEGSSFGGDKSSTVLSKAKEYDDLYGEVDVDELIGQQMHKF